MNFIRAEVSKFCASKRLTEASIRELDQKIQTESYLREKKEAILQDRKQEQMGEVYGADEDQKSCLQQVQDKYQSLLEDVQERRSHVSRTGSHIARNQVTQSLVGSAALLKERLLHDFGMPAEDDKLSTITGLEDEIDEWAALNKYAVYRAYQDSQENKKAQQQRKEVMREELERQQREFRQRQELFKLEQVNFAREQSLRGKIQDEID